MEYVIKMRTLFAEQLERPCTVNRESCLCTSGEDATISVESGVEDEDGCSGADGMSSEVHSGDGRGQTKQHSERSHVHSIRQPTP